MERSDAAVLWAKACTHLKDILHADVYERWIAVIHPDRIEENALVLSVDNDFYQTWLEENYLSLIQSAMGVVSEEHFDIRFMVKEPAAEPAGTAARNAAEPAVPKRRIPRERFFQAKNTSASLNPSFTFEKFIIGPSNHFAHAAAMAVAQAPARAYNPLFIYGGVGLGKTHIMQAIGHHVLTNSKASVCYLSSESFTNEYIEALQGNSLTQFRKKYRNVDLLLIDDIHFLAGKNAMQEEFFHTFNTLFDARKQIVMTSDRPASEITKLEQRLVSRFEWGLVTELEPPDLETRIAILRNKRAQLNVNISDEIISFIAENIKSNFRPLEGAFTRVVSYMSLIGKEISLQTVRSLLKDILDKEQAVDLSFDSIQRAVAEQYDVRLTDMTSKKRPRTVAVPRQVAMYLCRKMTSSSLPDIANAFGKTHATVLHAFKSVESRMELDQDLRQKVHSISKKLGKSF